MRWWGVVSVVVLSLGACGGGGDSGDDLTVTEYCVQQVEAFYDANDLPFTSKPEERAGICEDWMTEHDITTKAEIVIVLREQQAELDAVD